MRVPSSGRRRRVAAFAATVACAVALLAHVYSPVAADRPASAAPAGLDDAGYFAVADGLQRRLDPLWDPALGRYEPGPGATTTQVNADLLLVHSLAALRGHRGPTRADARARSIARFLVGPQVWTTRPPLGADPQVTGPGWISGPGRTGRHMVYDTAAVDGLVHAYLARHVLGLDRRTVTLHPRRDPPRRHQPRLALAGAQAQPDQLVLRDVRRRRDRQRRAQGARRRDGASPRAASCPARRATERRPATSARGCASTTCRSAGCAPARTSTRPSTPTSC